MNTRNIIPIATWAPETGNITIDQLVLKDFNHYFFDGGGGLVSYCLKASTAETEYFANNIPIPASVIQQWGASDDIIFEYVADALGLVLV